MDLKLIVVDDEQEVLAAVKRVLIRYCGWFDIVLTSDTDQVMRMVKEDDSVFCVISDMCMTRMNGIDLLAEIGRKNPRIVKILFSGWLDRDSAINAVNEGMVWQLIEKPFDNKAFVKRVLQAYEVYVTRAKEASMLEETVEGVVSVLGEVLSLTNPMAFSMTMRVRDIVKQLSQHLKIKDQWQVEMAAMLCQIGSVTVPGDILKKNYFCEELSEDEQDLINSIPRLGYNLIERIPRLKIVAEMLLRQNDRFDKRREYRGCVEVRDVYMGADILSCAIAFDRLLTCGYLPGESVEMLYKEENAFNPEVLVVLPLVNFSEKQERGFEMNINDLQPGMRLAQNVHNKEGMMLASCGQEVTMMMKMMFLNYYGRDSLHDIILVDPYRFKSEDDEDSNEKDEK